MEKCLGGLINASCYYYRPSWLEVEKAAIFFLTFWVRVHIAINSYCLNKFIIFC